MSRKSTMRTSEDFVRIERELRDEKMEEQAQDQDHLEEEDEDEGEQGQASMILGQYQHVQLPFWDKTCDIDRGESHRKRCYSRQLASEEQRIAKYVRSGRSQKLVSRNPCSKLKQENEAGKGLQVHGDLVARFIRKKERQNKVCTSKGPKDRRVRLSANTAIQFYDVQDRLGYDQSSKAIDWLIEKAKAAIEALAELPAQDYNSVDAIKCVTQPEPVMRDGSLYQLQHHQGCDSWSQKILVGSSSKYDMENPQHLNETTMNNEGIFSMVSQFQDYPTQQNSEQGLCLSLQSSESQDPYLHHSSPIDYGELALNSASSLTDLNSIDTGRLQSLMALNSSAGNEGEEFFFNSLPSLLQPPLLRENQFFSQRGPLQSNSLFSLHASTNPPIFVHGHANTESPNSLLLSSKGFSSGGFVGI